MSIVWNNQIKTITFYLPQFHRTTENDQWWGDGFTDWTSASNAQPLFEGHYQPRIPLDGRYYDLLDKETMQWQMELMRQYGIYGQCIYHYWFKDSRQILEKPAENLLRWTDLEMPFCFCWPVESWARTWSGIEGANAWAAIRECRLGRDDDGILLQQDFGGMAEWKAHFEYLLPFFRDERYIRKNGKPVFLIHKLELVDCLGEMIRFWRRLAIEAGMDGIYIIGSVGRKASDDLFDGIIDAYYYHEPAYSRQSYTRVEWRDSVRCSDYDEVWRTILSQPLQRNKEVYPTGFVDFDSTPRMGNAGNLCYGAKPEKFCHYFSQLIWKAQQQHREFVFLNAWNEWGEGMYLEPDEKYGHAYLEAIRDALEHPRVCEEKQPGADMYKECEELRAENERYRSYWKIFDRWLLLKESNINLSTWFEERSIHNIALYGMGMMTAHLLAELRDSNIHICFGIDRQSLLKHYEFPVYDMRQDWPGEEMAEAIIVTTTYDVEEIKKRIQDRSSVKTVSIIEIIQDLCDC